MEMTIRVSVVKWKLNTEGSLTTIGTKRVACSATYRLTDDSQTGLTDSGGTESSSGRLRDIRRHLGVPITSATGFLEATLPTLKMRNTLSSNLLPEAGRAGVGGRQVFWGRDAYAMHPTARLSHTTPTQPATSEWSFRGRCSSTPAWPGEFFSFSLSLGRH